MEKLVDWLSDDENARVIPPNQINIIIGELASRKIGIRGNNTFTITFPLLWNVRQFTFIKHFKPRHFLLLNVDLRHVFI